MKALIVFLICLLVAPAFAGDSGSYFNPDRNREGLLLQRHNEPAPAEARIYWTFFTYGAQTCIPGEEIEVVVEICNQNGQRWFFGVSTWDETTQSSIGFVYITTGIDYPFAINNDVASATIVGTFVLVRSGNGFAMDIDRFGNELSPDDSLFADFYDWPVAIFKASD